MAVRAVTAHPASRRALLAAVPAALAGSLAACSAGSEFPAGPFRIASGGEGGVYYAYAHGIANVVQAALPRLRPVVLATAASVENLRLVSHDGSAVGFATADVAADAYRGTASFATPLPVVALARVYENYLHLAVRRDLRVTVLSQLRGRRVSIGPVGSATEVVATRLLSLAGMDPARDLRADGLDPDAAARAVAAGVLDAMFFSGGVPTAAIVDLSRRVPITLVDLSGYLPALRERYGEVYFARTIPASAYGLDVPTATVGVPNFLVVERSMPQRLAYRLVKALFEHRNLLAAAHPEGQRLDRGAAIATDPLPLHPGAVRYYREAKN
ncbi:TAXI family TRAP transporter solute-binding subunit [Rugosimonospora africana]|uniref:C4-dicarboxylate ABC transporter substrate-binding protein n=1 Tax=Rugosimonospora africana TaxID=556532 RepID=A0A8J3QN55_9ACTN|nr:TAXI family TRAP transporter solute-binding subunit [Rugosimonospora africana]GIH13994.1 C4-dicarboxylate ABC transporter substrate-binding protein [Rugosimonospora africana]